MNDSGMTTNNELQNPSMIPRPTNSLVTPLLTDLYQITMTYAHWKNGRHNDSSVFELFFRKNPFGGEFTIFCGLEECLKHLHHFSFSPDDIAYLQSTPALAHIAMEEDFWTYLETLDCSQIQVRAMREGTVAFPRVPLMVIEGPLGICQLLETTLLTLVNYPSLIATNAARMVMAAKGKVKAGAATNTDNVPLLLSTSEHGRKLTQHYSDPYWMTNHASLPAQCWVEPKCVEFGLRRAQGPDGGFSASKYSHIGGFVGTSNVQAGKLLHLNIAGTHAHSFVQAYTSLSEVQDCTLRPKNSNSSTDHGANALNLLDLCLSKRQELARNGDDYCLQANEGELAAFIAYAAAFPNSFLCLIDTYDTLKSGLRNFCVVAMVLVDLGYTPRGIRLDSGDLAYLSLEVARLFAEIATTSDNNTSTTTEEEELFPYQCFSQLDIVASNDINEDVLLALNQQGHAVTLFGIGTNLVTCQKQPALGCVYKLVELKGTPRIKLSQEIEKVLIPGRKRPYRLYGASGLPLLDLMVSSSSSSSSSSSTSHKEEEEPTVGQRILCRHPFIERKRVAVIPARVEPLHHIVFDHGQVNMEFLPSTEQYIPETMQYVQTQLEQVRPDVLRFSNPTPYKVSVTSHLFTYLHELWQAETPVMELS